MNQKDMIIKAWRLVMEREPVPKRVPRTCPLCSQNVHLIDGLLEVHSRADGGGRRRRSRTIGGARRRQEYCSRSGSALGRNER